MTTIPTEQPPAAVPIPPATVSDVGWLERMKLAEPVRLYLYGLALVAVAGLQLAGVLSGEWAEFCVRDSAIVLGVAGAGAEAARASVYSPRGLMRTLSRGAGPVVAARLAKDLDL